MRYKVWTDKQNYIEFNNKDDFIKFLETIKNDNNIIIEITMQSFTTYESWRLR